MEKQDDRTEEQKEKMNWGVVARDTFLSGWGGAQGGYSRCAWAYNSLGDATRGFNWVKNRSDMIYVNIVDLNTYRPPRGTAHFHIYVAESNHPSLD